MKAAFSLVLVSLLSPAVHAWDAAGHSAITLMALDRLKNAGTPAWLNEDETRSRVAWQSGEPDRWRGTRTATLKHENDPDHYIDIEDLKGYGLTLRTVPMLRYEFVKALSKGRELHPDKVRPVNPATDSAKTAEWPGFLPQAIMEHYEKLRSGMNTLRILESLPDASSARRRLQIEQAKSNIRGEMGLLAHFVGDAAQPLHTTQHHHGWVGDNPKGYTADRSIHAYIDGVILAHHKLNRDTISKEPPAEGAKEESRVHDVQNPWSDVLAHIERSFASVEPLYELKKSGELEQAEGKKFITDRLNDAAAMLADLYAAAWKAGEPTAKDIEDYLKYEAKE